MGEGWPGGWLPRRPPLPPVAVVGQGPAAGALARVAAERIAAGDVLSAVRGHDLLVIRAIVGELPWAPDVTYFGEIDGLLLPIHTRPARSPALLASRCRGLALPVLVLPEGRLLPLGRAVPCPVERLRAPGSG